MNLPKAKRIKLAKLLALVKEIPTEEGTVLFVEGDVTVDAEIFVSDADGNMVPAPDGTYTSEGKIITVAGGKISEIKDVKEKPVTNPENPESMEEENPENPDPMDTDNPDELKARIAELETEIAEKDNKIAELEAKIAEYEQNEETPAADSIEDEEKKKQFKKEDSSLVQRLLNAAHSNGNRITNLNK